MRILNVCLLALICGILLLACSHAKRHFNQVENAIPLEEQGVLFDRLLEVVGNQIPGKLLHDSLSFLVIPIDASCHYCRDKCVDSLISNIDKMGDSRVVIISSNGLKALKGYFTERKKDIPIGSSKIIIDYNNVAYVNDLVFLNPMFYYCHDKKVYEQIKGVPTRIKDNLHDFFTR